jgi:hypothetical protein
MSARTVPTGHDRKNTTASKLALTLLVTVLVAAVAASPALGAPPSAVHTGTAYAVKPYKVKGKISVSEDDSSRTVTVKLDLSGFTPGTSHVMHIHKGLMCEAMEMNKAPSMSMAMSMGKILVPLGIHKADAEGDMHLTITVKHAPLLDFGHIHVMVHYGPSITAKPLWASPVTCADIP